MFVSVFFLPVIDGSVVLYSCSYGGFMVIFSARRIGLVAMVQHLLRCKLGCSNTKKPTLTNNKPKHLKKETPQT